MAREPLPMRSWGESHHLGTGGTRTANFTFIDVASQVGFRGSLAMALSKRPYGIADLARITQLSDSDSQRTIFKQADLLGRSFRCCSLHSRHTLLHIRRYYLSSTACTAWTGVS